MGNASLVHNRPILMKPAGTVKLKAANPSIVQLKVGRHLVVPNRVEQPIIEATNPPLPLDSRVRGNDG